MRVLVSVRPYVGHLQPVLPMLEALVAAGHQVVVATSDELAVEVEERGLGWQPAGVHPAQWAAEHPGDDPSYGLGAVGAKARDLIAVAEEVAADLVLRDATDVAATVAAEVVGLPLAVYSVSHYLRVRVWRRLAGRTLQAVRAEHGLDADSGLARLTSTPYFDVMPPMLQVPATMELSAHHVVRYESRDDSPAEARHDDGLAAGSPASAVLASFGTVFNDRARLWRTVLGALTELDVPVVATGGSDRVQALAASVGGKVRVAGYAPHSRLLPGCRVLVCHGGFNTMMGAICAGVPMVCLPMAGDQYYNAEMVARLGLGFRLSSSRVSQRELRAAVIELLADPAYATRVREVRDSMTSLPPAASVVAVLERLGRR